MPPIRDRIAVRCSAAVATCPSRWRPSRPRAGQVTPWARPRATRAGSSWRPHAGDTAVGGRHGANCVVAPAHGPGGDHRALCAARRVRPRPGACSWRAERRPVQTHSRSRCDPRPPPRVRSRMCDPPAAIRGGRSMRNRGTSGRQLPSPAGRCRSRPSTRRSRSHRGACAGAPITGRPLTDWYRDRRTAADAELAAAVRAFHAPPVSRACVRAARSDRDGRGVLRAVMKSSGRPPSSRRSAHPRALVTVSCAESTPPCTLSGAAR
jgi:hypothetical protein